MSYNLLKGKKGIISGALDESSIAWKVATRCFEEGAAITLTNAPIAMRMGKIKDLAQAVNAEIVPADATSTDDLTKLFQRTVEIHGGGIDFILHSIVHKKNPPAGGWIPCNTIKISFEIIKLIKAFDTNANYQWAVITTSSSRLPKTVQDHCRSAGVSATQGWTLTGRCTH